MSLFIEHNVALAPLTTLKVGGAARFFVEAKNETEVLQAISFVKENDLPLFILGGGSNVLISDEGFDGLVLKISLKGISSYQDKSDVFVKVQAGEDWDSFVDFCIENKLQGVECLSGIPGTIGGTPVQNVGAYGQEVAETIASVRALEIKTGEIFEMTNAECGFSYRTSKFNTTHKNQYIVLAVTYCLKPNGKAKIVYQDLKEFFAGRTPTLKETRRAVLRIRAAKSMVIDEHDPNSKSAGSFFKNPVVPLDKFLEIERLAKLQGVDSIPKFIIDDERVKIPAAWLIEKCGFQKGFKLGKAGISSKHALALINSDGATAQDILALKDEIQKKVFNQFGIRLKTEPEFVGFFNIPIL